MRSSVCRSRTVTTYRRVFATFPTLCEYVSVQNKTNGEVFDHRFYANKEKGYWEVIDTNNLTDNNVNLSYMAMKDDVYREFFGGKTDVFSLVFYWRGKDFFEEIRESILKNS